MTATLELAAVEDGASEDEAAVEGVSAAVDELVVAAGVEEEDGAAEELTDTAPVEEEVAGGATETPAPATFSVKAALVAAVLYSVT